MWPLNPEAGRKSDSLPCVPYLHYTDTQKATSLLAPAIKQKPCEPVTIQHLECLCTCLNFDDPFDATVFAIACLAFWSQARLGELLFDSTYDPQHHIAHGGIVFGMSSSNRGYGKGWLPRTKTKPQGDWLLFTDSECANSACHAPKWHLFSNSIVPDSGPLFAFETLDGLWCPMKKSWFLAQCNSI